MCGRFDQDQSNAAINALVERLRERQKAPPLPQGLHPGAEAITLLPGGAGGEPELMAWGFPRQDGKGVIFNARCESVLTKPFFRNALLRNPLIAPATGFYEWRGARGHKEKFLFRAAEPGALLYLAGFWRNFDGAPHFTILTRPANAFMEPYHHRMPLIMPPEQVEAWLHGGHAEELLEMGSVKLEVEGHHQANTARSELPSSIDQ